MPSAIGMQVSRRFPRATAALAFVFVALFASPASALQIGGGGDTFNPCAPRSSGPTADFTHSLSPRAGSPIAFSAASSTPAKTTYYQWNDADGFCEEQSEVEHAIESYSWDFGDGTTATGANPIHTYAADGTYTVMLTVSAGVNGSDSETRAIAVDVPTTPVEPPAPTPTTPLTAPVAFHFGTLNAVSSSGERDNPLDSSDAAVTYGKDDHHAVIGLRDARTILDLDQLNLLSDKRLDFVFTDRTDIVLLRVGNAEAAVAGILRGKIGTSEGAPGGNIWIVDRNNVVYRPTARVAAGGLHATTADIANQDFFEGRFNFEAAPPGSSISVQGGASLEAWGGVLGLVAPVIEQHAAPQSQAPTFVGAAPSAPHGATEVLYGSADLYSLSLAPGSFGYDLLSFTVPEGGATTGLLDLNGATSAGEIFMGSVADAPASAVVNSTGSLSTERGAALGGDIVLAGGAGLSRPTADHAMQPVPHAGAASQPMTLKTVDAEGALTARSAGVLSLTGPASAFAPDDALLTAAGALSIGPGGRVSGDDVVLSTGGDFVNSRGGEAIAATGRWLVYLDDLAGNDYGGLNSGSTALWGRTIGSAGLGGIAGNRYVFRHSPTLTFASRDLQKVRGDDATDALEYSVSGMHPGVPGVFDADTAATAYTGAPAISSAGVGASASLVGSPYPITVSKGTLASPAGYAFAFDNAGLLTLLPGMCDPGGTYEAAVCDPDGDASSTPTGTTENTSTPTTTAVTSEESTPAETRKAGKCAKLKGKKRAACVKKACAKAKKQSRKKYRACKTRVTRRAQS